MTMLRRVPTLFAAVVLLVRFSLVLGSLECEDLTTEECAFAVSSSGVRCVLEKSILLNGETMPDCQTSLIMAERPEVWIESDECMTSCGLERETYGLSTDALMEAGFADKLCSAECQNNCPNIVDLYFKLAAGEGVYLPRLCTERRFRARRLIADPLQVAKYGPEGGRVGGGVWSSTHVIDDNNHNLEKQRTGPWDSSLVSTPQPSPVYGPPTGPLTAAPTKSKPKKPVSSSAQAPAPTPTLTPGPLSSPAYQASTVTVENDYHEEEIRY